MVKRHLLILTCLIFIAATPVQAEEWLTGLWPCFAAGNVPTPISSDITLSQEELNEFLNELNSGSQTLELKDMVDEYADFKSSVLNVKDISNSKGSDIVSSTLAELYYEQGHYKDSLELYNKLLLINPADKSIIERIEKLKSLDVRSDG